MSLASDEPEVFRVELLNFTNSRIVHFDVDDTVFVGPSDHTVASATHPEIEVRRDLDVVTRNEASWISPTIRFRVYLNAALTWSFFDPPDPTVLMEIAWFAGMVRIGLRMLASFLVVLAGVHD
jgi:hypothetical protein